MDKNISRGFIKFANIKRFSKGVAYLTSLWYNTLCNTAPLWGFVVKIGKRTFSDKGVSNMEKNKLDQVRLGYEAPMLQLIVVSSEDIVRTSSSDADGGEYDWA